MPERLLVLVVEIIVTRNPLHVESVAVAQKFINSKLSGFHMYKNGNSFVI